MEAPKFRYRVECRDSTGGLRWIEDVENLVTTAGKTDLVAKYFAGSAYTAVWYVGLKNTGSATVADTMASHAGWTENTTYVSATRPSITFGAAAAGSIASTNTITFAMNGTTTVFGAFIVNQNTAGGSTGTLYSATDFTLSRAVISGDTLTVSLTLTVS